MTSGDQGRHREKGDTGQKRNMSMQIETHVQYNHSYMTTDEYMAQEEDWDRDLLLDPAWEKQQRKVGNIQGDCSGARVGLSGLTVHSVAGRAQGGHNAKTQSQPRFIW